MHADFMYFIHFLFPHVLAVKNATSNAKGRREERVKSFEKSQRVFNFFFFFNSHVPLSFIHQTSIFFKESYEDKRLTLKYGGLQWKQYKEASVCIVIYIKMKGERVV